jgi:hypothetical protein
VSQLHGDLDWIVLKCLEKDRTRRYATAIGLGEDIERYLHEEPVLARPPSQLYRLQKLVRRNPRVFLSATAAIAVLVLSSIISTCLLINEKEALRTAVAARQEAEMARAREAQLRREAESRETVRQAGLLMALDQYDQADDLLATITLEKPSLESEALLRTLGDWNAIHGRWSRAVERFGLLVKLNPLDDLGVTLDHFRLGAALIESGKPDDYERFRQEIVLRFGSITNPLPDRLIKCCLMLPANSQILQNLQTSAEIAEKELEFALRAKDRQILTAFGSGFRQPWTSSALALFEYRRGDYVKATAFCTRCLSSPGSNGPPGALAHVIQALAYWRLHQETEALAALTRGQELIDVAFKNGLNLNLNDDLENWFDWVLARIVMRECQKQVFAIDPSNKTVDK